MKLLFVIITFFSAPGMLPEKPDYRKVFGSDYQHAVEWLSKHDSLFQHWGGRFNIPARELQAIVFPELIRYNKVFDVIQIESLKYLYVSEGIFYADFSVGQFQMKPSFAERVEQDAGRLPDNSFYHQTGFNRYNQSGDSEAGRKARLSRITDVEKQLIYLCAFYKICLDKFPVNSRWSASERVRLLATCYNAGYQHDYNTILKLQGKNQFYGHNYSSISVSYFDNEKATVPGTVAIK